MALASTIQAERVTQIAGASNDLNIAIERLDVALTKLRDRLAPILSMQTPVAPPRNEKLMEPKAPLAEYINGIVNRVHELEGQVINIIERCEC